MDQRRTVKKIFGSEIWAVAEMGKKRLGAWEREIY
jgi:hypothetical protein